MLACRLCLAIGNDDPEAWLESASERQLLIWKAFYRLEPWGMEFHRHATLSTLISGLVSMIAASNGQKLDVRDFAEFMPSDWIDPAKKPSPKKRKKKLASTLNMLAACVPTAQQRRINGNNA